MGLQAEDTMRLAVVEGRRRRQIGPAGGALEQRQWQRWAVAWLQGVGGGAPSWGRGCVRLIEGRGAVLRCAIWPRMKGSCCDEERRRRQIGPAGGALEQRQWQRWAVAWLQGVGGGATSWRRSCVRLIEGRGAVLRCAIWPRMKGSCCDEERRRGGPMEVRSL
ncbi:hypothetical protein JCGZ_08560 [Jatropha curcas]|uniref:Uncharacterized protein n=1 Tax=Jatropha curcas TaxID=180498 RepID=A0A067KPL3_JATCU|nr:hypothetical protein JCGZ_08560 [Jatropha curcas]